MHNACGLTSVLHVVICDPRQELHVWNPLDIKVSNGTTISPSPQTKNRNFTYTRTGIIYYDDRNCRRSGCHWRSTEHLVFVVVFLAYIHIC